MKVGIREGVTPTEAQQKSFEHLCSTCLYSEPYKPDVRFDFAMFINRLQNAGVIFGINDLKVDEWIWVEQYKNAVNEYQKEEMANLKNKMKNQK